MKNNLLFVAMVFIVSTMSLLTGCKNNETSLQNDITQVDSTQHPYLSKNKQIKQEIQYLIDESRIKKDQLKDLRWFAPEILADGSKLDPMLQGYILKGTDIGLGSRVSIQEDMKLKAESGSQEFYKHTKRAEE